MTVGIGGGANLGSATGYLFVDPKGVARGLNQAAAEFNKFEKATERVGQSMSRALDATAAARKANQAFSPTNLNALRASQATVISTLAATTQEFAKQHKQREDILKRHGTNLRADAALARDYNKQVLAENKKLTVAQERLARSRANLDKAISGGQTGRRLGGFKGAVTRDINEIKKLEDSIKSLSNAAADATARKNAAGATTAQALARTYDVERRAIQDVNKALTDQASLRRQIVRDAGLPDLDKFATAAERASTRYVRASQAMIAAQGKLDDITARQVTTTSQIGQEKLAAQQNRLMQQRARFADIAQQQLSILKAADADFTRVTEAEVNKRIDLAKKEQAAFQAVQAERAKIARQQLLVKGTDVAVKGAIALGAAIGLSTAAFVQFEQKMLQVQSVSQDTDTELATMTQRIRDLAVELGQSPTALAEGLYTIVQAGFDGSEALVILEQAARASVAGLTDVETAARPLIAVMSAYGEAAGTAKEVSDVLFEAVTAGVFSFEDLAGQIGDNVPLAAQMGVTLEELAASYIVLTKQGNSLSESTTQVNGILRAFLKPTTALQEVLEDAGFATGALAVEELGLAGAMEVALRAADGNNDALADMFPLIRGLRGVVALSVDDWSQYDAAMRQVSSSSEGVGRTQETLAKQMESTAFQLRVAREEIRGAAISLGSDFAPAVVNLATALGSAAQAIGSFNEATGGMAANVVTFGFALSVAFVGVSKIITAIRTATQVYKELTIATLASNRAMTAIRFTPMALALTAVITMTATLINRHRDHQRAVEDLQQAYDDLREHIEQLRLQGNVKDALTLEKLDLDMQATQESVDALKESYSNMITSIERQTEGVTPGEVPEIDALNQSITNLKENLADLEDVEKVLQEAHVLMLDAFAQPNVDIQRLAEAFAFLNANLRATGDLDAYIEGVRAVRENISQYADEAKVAANSTDALGDEVEEIPESMKSVAEFFGSLTADSEEFRKAVAGVIQDSRELLGLGAGIEDPFGFINAIKGLESTNVFDQLLDLTKRRETDLVRLSPATKEAFELADQLARVVANMDRLDERFQQNADDISMWQGRIDLLNDTLGENTDTLSEYERQLAAGEITQEEFNEAVASGEAHVALAGLQKLLDDGRISQQEYNRIKEAAIFLHERSAGALEDERREQALLIPKLAEYVKERDRLNQQIGELDSGTQARIAALQSEAGQMAINTAVMLRMLEVMGLIPEGVATQFIADISQADPLLGALFDDIGLLKEESPVEIDVTTSEDTRALVNNLEQVRDRMRDLTREKLDLQVSGGRIDATEIERVNEILAELDSLRDQEIAIEFVLAAGGTVEDIAEIVEGVNEIKKTKAGFSIDVDSKEAAAQIREILGLEIGDKRFKITIDGIEGTESLDRELERRIRKSAEDAGFTGFDNKGFLANFRFKVTSEDTSAGERLSEIAFLIQAITGDKNAVSIDVDTKAAETAILALTGYIDQTLLTPDFIAYLDANNDGALDAAELARLAMEDFDGVYTAYLIAEAEDAKQDLKEVDGIKTEVLEDGTLHVTAETSEAMDEWMALNGGSLEGAVFPVRIEMDTTVEEGTAAFDPAAGLREGGDAGTSVKVEVTADTSGAETELKTFTDTVLPAAQATASTKATDIGQAVTDGITTGSSAASDNVSAEMNAVVGAMDRSGETWNIGFNTGWNLGDGIRAGIAATVGAIASAAAEAVNAAESAARDAADSASPSKLFARLGRDLMAGLAMGVEDEERALSSSIYNSMRGAFIATPATMQMNAMVAGAPVSPAVIASAGRGDTYNVSMQVTVPAANFREWIGTVEFVQEVKRGFGTALAGSRGR